MKLISTGKELAKLIEKLIVKHDKVSFAFAWATTGILAYDLLHSNKNKIVKGIFGTHFYQTDPQALEDFVGSKSVRFILQPSGVFHPKVIIFYSQKNWDLIIGSANLTSGAFNNNSELMLHISSSQEESLKKDVLEKIDIYFKAAETMTSERAIDYRKLYEKMRLKLSALYNNYGNNKDKAKPPIKTKILPLSWSDYYSEVQDDNTHGTDARLKLLREINVAFSKTETFSNMDVEIRKAIGGFESKRIENAKWFGSMKGVGYFAQAINQNNQYISNALDFIPLTGEINRNDYLNFIEEYKKAFPKGRHGIATSSRLLAMKRPDYFVCLDKRNAKGICDDFGVTRSGITYERYWDELLQRIYNSVWWQSDKPKGKRELEAWNARAAMLDAIFYDA